MERFDPELLKVIERLKQHRRKKQEIQQNEGTDPQGFWDANGRIIALAHAIQ